ncbi:ATP-binding protein [Variovorax sp. OV329]|uniref:ATP-binding protein n=1 Tax=Variovorax sp. OV329 TaxID=1882825 RepID=UPI0008E32705|nr:ATP-binding protein [Variovorax sp. OV329]SFN27167.1 two-component system, OmpR family, osmolarity sensor histidine kinase EnvZ [Variovorax sp. OV329]
MSWLPRSLFGRNALLIVLLIVLSQLGSALLLEHLVVRPRLAQLAESVARSIASIHHGLEALPPAQQQAYVQAFNEQARQRAGQAPAAAPVLMQTELTAFQRGFVDAVSQRLAGQDVEVSWRHEDGGSLALRMKKLAGGEQTVLLPGVLPERDFAGTWLMMTLCVVLLAIAGALWFQWRLNRPLVRVVGAARTLAAGQPPAPLPEDGPTEIATVSHSFNQLVASLDRTERERALLLAGISHDLRTPLTKLRLGVEILGGSSEPELTASMARSIEELDAIVQQFVDFARGETDEPRVPMDLNALAAQVQAANIDHGRTLALETAPSLPPVKVRAQALRRVLDNLVENAFRHGKPPVGLRTGQDREQAMVWIEVTDRGQGVAPDQVEVLKQPFRRAGGESRSGVSGSGLGLAIVDRIARGHGGRLDLLPHEGGGLRVRVSLPLA